MTNDKHNDWLAELEAVFRYGSFAIATFLAITALEETAKVHVGMYRRSQEMPSRRDDPLYRDKTKHMLGAAPTIPMGSRLAEAIGSEKLEALMNRARGGQLVSLREQCLYLESKDGHLVVPSEQITREDTRAMLLFAIEAFDDALVGYTNHSFDVGKRADALFDSLRVA